MFKHIEDDGDLSILVNDEGSLLIVCSQRHRWIGTLQKPAEETGAGGLVVSLSTRTDLAEAVGVSPESLG